MPLYSRTSDDLRHTRSGPIRIDLEHSFSASQDSVPYPVRQVVKHINLSTRDPIP